MTLDEAQYIKNAATKVSKAVRSVTAVHRFALTGTPIENRLSELWSIFDFLMPGMLGSYAHFRERFEMPVLSGDETAQKKLQSFVGPFILRRLKSQVLRICPTRSRTSSQCSCRGAAQAVCGTGAAAALGHPEAASVGFQHRQNPDSGAADPTAASMLRPAADIRERRRACQCLERRGAIRRERPTAVRETACETVEGAQDRKLRETGRHHRTGGLLP